MHPDRTFHWQDRAEMRRFVEHVGLCTLFAPTADGLRAAQVPVLFLDDDRIGFHLSRHNALAGAMADGDALMVVQGPHAYVSPDWYGMDDQVPTWNYMSVELEGHVAAMDRNNLSDLIDALSAHREATLTPKPPWTRDKMGDGLFDRMLGGITGYSMAITHWRGTRKLGQNKPAAARAAVADALTAQGAHAIATLMRETAS